MVDVFSTGHVLWSMYLTQGISMVDVFNTGHVQMSMHFIQDMFYGRCIKHRTCSMVNAFYTGYVL